MKFLMLGLFLLSGVFLLGSGGSLAKDQNASLIVIPAPTKCPEITMEQIVGPAFSDAARREIESEPIDPVQNALLSLTSRNPTVTDLRLKELAQEERARRLEDFDRRRQQKIEEYFLIRKLRQEAGQPCP